MGVLRDWRGREVWRACDGFFPGGPDGDILSPDGADAGHCLPCDGVGPLGLC